MPELPEVETVKETLALKYLNKTILNVKVYYDKILENIDASTFCEILKNQKILSFSRKGKYIIIHLSNSHLLIHLRMEGKFKFDVSLIDKHAHVVLEFSDHSYLIYHDVRKFGRIYYFAKEVNIFKENPLKKLGLEPFEITHIDQFYQKIKKINRPIKSVLLDQSIIAGIGNIYADEICFACHLNPLKKASMISKTKAKEIIKQAQRILNEAILCGGSTIKSFQSAHGVDGLFQTHLKVYGRENLPCYECHELISKVFINQRGTHFCKRCQK